MVRISMQRISLKLDKMTISEVNIHVYMFRQINCIVWISS